MQKNRDIAIWYSLTSEPTLLWYTYPTVLHTQPPETQCISTSCYSPWDFLVPNDWVWYGARWWRHFVEHLGLHNWWSAVRQKHVDLKWELEVGREAWVCRRHLSMTRGILINSPSLSTTLPFGGCLVEAGNLFENTMVWNLSKGWTPMKTLYKSQHQN